MTRSSPATAELRTRIEAARRAGRALAALPGERRTRALRACAAALQSADATTSILAANREDVAQAQVAVSAGELDQALLQRLSLDPAKLQGLAQGLEQLAGQADLVGRVELRRELDVALVLERVSAPLGVLAVVFESRPDALVQIAGLALRSGNAAVLKGGREAARTNAALTNVLQSALHAEGLAPEALTLIETRADVQALLAFDDLVDLVVARGSSSFVAQVRASTRIPVLSHAAGVCHLYLHASAEPAMAAHLAVDGKCSYPAACNSIETLLWDAAAAPALDACVAALHGAGVELRGCSATRARHPGVLTASEADWDLEYGTKVLALRQVTDLDSALAHIARHGSRHTEAIVAADRAAAERFLAEVDAAGVYWNASTRFADGFRYGLGAEVGISTDKLHARGPVGVEGLLTYRWLVRGQGQASTDYGKQRGFSHTTLARAEVVTALPTSPRLHFRELELADLDFVAAMLADPEVMRYYPKPLVRDEARTWLLRQRDRYRAHGHGLWLIEERATGRPIGQVGLVMQYPHGRPEREVGYLVHRPYWRQGFGSEAAGAVRDWAFAHLRVSQVISLIRPENEPSRGVARKLGLTESGHCRHAGLDHIVYAQPRP